MTKITHSTPLAQTTLEYYGKKATYAAMDAVFIGLMTGILFAVGAALPGILYLAGHSKIVGHVALGVGGFAGLTGFTKGIEEVRNRRDSTRDRENQKTPGYLSRVNQALNRLSPLRKEMETQQNDKL